MEKRGLPPFSPSRVCVIVERKHLIVRCSYSDISPFKSRDEISFQGEGCDTPIVIIAAKVFLQYLYTIIINVTWFKFKFEFESYL
jgi:hypothetical protein